MIGLRLSKIIVSAGLSALLLAACNAPPLKGSDTTPTDTTPTATVTRTPVGGEVAVNPITPGATGTIYYDSSMSPTALYVPPTATSPSAGSAPTAAPPTLLPTADTNIGPFAALPTAQPGTIIQSFTISKSVADPGETISLTWQTKGSEVTVYHILATGQYGSFYPVEQNGSMQYTIDPAYRNHDNFQLVATLNGAIEYANITIKLTCPDTWFFDNPPAMCPQNSAVISGGVGQRFETGTMLWLANTKMIMVLHGSGTSGMGWKQYPDTWDSSQPELDPGIAPPAGYYQPVRGFGKVWREMGERTILGWAIGAEFSVAQISFQCDSAPKYPTCYLQSPDGLLKLGPWGSGWALYSGP